MVDEALERGLYVILDWHILNPGDPWENIEYAREFFSYMSAKHGSKGHVLYELCNEPNGVAWSRIKTYAEDLIPLIRANDPDGIIIVGTPAWSSFGISEGRDPMEMVNNALSGANGHNVMYAFHFYAASHKSDYLSKIRNVADSLPIFVTEWGTQTYSGDGTNDVESSQQWIDLMAEKKISWAGWNFSDDWRSGAVLKSGTCPNGPWSSSGLKESGQLLMDWIRNTSVQQSSKIVVGYFPAWGIYYDYFVKDIDPSKITHINYAFINVRDNTPVIGVTERNVGDAWADYQRTISAAESVDGIGDTWDQTLKGNWNQLRKLKDLNPHIKVLAALGGWTWSSGFSDAALPENREAFVAACIDTLILGNIPYDANSNTGGSGSAAGVFDGIDIDWEYPVCCGLGNNYRPEDKANYTALLAEFRKQLDQIDPALLLTIAAPAGPHNIINHEWDQIPQHLNFINLMTYDYHGSWDANTGHLAPMYAASDDPSAQTGWSMDETVRTYHVNYGIPKEKLVLGLPFYGRSWTGVAPGPNGDGLYQSATGDGPGERDEPGMLNYHTIIGTYEPAYFKYSHTETKTPWLYNGSNFITYDDPAAISTKAQYILQQGLAGAMFWNLMSDVKGNPAPANSLLSALWDGLGGIIPTYQCGDGIDNDSDGLVDLQDPGCSNAGDDNETDEAPPTTQCSDGVDNDGDGLIDLQDPDCINALDDDESTPAVCGEVETEISIRDDWGTGYCAEVTVVNNTCQSVNWTVNVAVDGTVDNLWNGKFVQGQNTIEVRGDGWNSEIAVGESTSFGFCVNREQPTVTYQCNDGIDNDGDGLVDLNDPGCANAEDNDETNANCGSVETEVSIRDDWGAGYCADVTVVNNTCQSVNWTVNVAVDGTVDNLWNGKFVQGQNTIEVQGDGWNSEIAVGESTSFGFCVNREQPTVTYQCNDGIDNDGDGLVDLQDPGCAGDEDNDETNGTSTDVMAEVKVADDWGTGYCSDVTIKNNSAEDIDWKVTLDVEGNIKSLWGALYEKNGDQLTLEGKDWNNIVAAGGSLSSIGFCVDR
ncbi:MAG: cellulase family glycosylhydrolase [Deltaproteobacteria bacterium]|nr:cellulase family glycosylhydrolase [Deltaproteobacteria bacterium]